VQTGYKHAHTFVIMYKTNLECVEILSGKCFEVEVTLRLTASQSVSLGVKPPSGAHDQCFLLFDIYGLVFVGRPL
jgi:hypothetical protein